MNISHLINWQRLDTLKAAIESTDPNIISLRSWKQETPCGTLYCALGLACTIPEFQELGLCIRPAQYSFSGQQSEVVYNHRKGYDAASEFFAQELSRLIRIFWEEKSYCNWNDEEKHHNNCYNDLENMFSPRMYDEENAENDKERWLNRYKNFCNKYRKIES